MKKKLSTLLLSILTCLMCVLGFSACTEGCREDTAHVHEYTKTVIAPTCTEQGYTKYTCACSNSYTADYINALGRDFGEYVSDDNATYEADGTKTAVCGREGCQAQDVVTETGTKLASGISFNTLSVDGNKIYGKVSNATTEFSFVDEISVTGIATFVVDNNKDCSTPIASKTVDLQIGDNTFYVLESVENDVQLYTVTLRRRPVYDVMFDSCGGSDVEKQTVEEDSLAQTPEAPKKTGYSFVAWDYDFTQPITENVYANASWTANTDTAYTVLHYLENLENNAYTLETTERRTGTTDTLATAEIKDFANYEFNPARSEMSGNIHPDGSLVLIVSYARVRYTVTFDGNGGTLTSGEATQSVKHGGEILTPPAFKRDGYTFIGFDKTDFANVCESFTVTAQWKANTYTLTIAYNNGQENDTMELDCGTPINLPEPTWEGYVFIGWDTDYSTMPPHDAVMRARWESLFKISGNTLTGLTDSGMLCTELTIPTHIYGAEITAIGENAFLYCKNLTSLDIKDGYLTEIGYSAFFGCENLQSVELPSSLTYIDEYAFWGCRSLERIEIPSKVEYIGKSAFEECTALQEVDMLYSKISAILEKVFYGCDSLTSFDFSNITSIGKSAFCSSGLTSVAIPYGLTEIKESAFQHCDDLVSVTFQNSHLEILRSSVFAYCYNLREVDLGNLREIWSYAFYSCYNLMNITIPATVESLSEKAFAYCYKLVDIYDLTDLNLSEIQWEDDGLFYRRWVHTEPYTSKLITDDDGYMILVDGNDRILMGYEGEETDLVLPSDITELYHYAFHSYNNITSVVIPNGIERIQRYTFAWCRNLERVEIPGTVERIEEGAFALCESLTSVELPSGLTKLDKWAFDNSGLTSIVIPGGVATIGEKAFIACENLITVEIQEGVQAIDKEAFVDCINLTSLIIPDSMQTIERLAFHGAQNLTSIVIGSGVKSIVEYAFFGIKLKDVYYKGTEQEWGEIEIGGGAFNTSTHTQYYYYSEEAPTVAGNWWRYVDGVPTKWE